MAAEYEAVLGGEAVEAPAAMETPAAGARARSGWLTYSFGGMVGAVLFTSAAFTPSLLPRSWYLQGLVDGLSAGIGYGLGAFLGWLVAGLVDWRPSWLLQRRAWLVLTVLATLLLSVAHTWGQRWQRDVRLLMGLESPPDYQWLPILLLTVVVFLGVIGTARALRWVTRQVNRPLLRFLPDGLARLAAVVLVALVAIGLNNDVLRPGLINIANRTFAAINDRTINGTVQPTAPERSGSPASLISWRSLGRKGRNFVGVGPTVAQLAAFSGRPAKQPVRVYAGLLSADTVQERAALAVRDLQRAGGFDRQVLAVTTTTGTGWVDESSVDSLEYMVNGDSAVIGMQYSYLPSWISFLVDRDKAQEAARVLFDAVHAAWAELPADHRPKLYVVGESLGTYGGEGAFDGLADILAQVDGVVWAGPTAVNPLHSWLVEHRDAGSSSWQPVYDAGRHVRFAGDADDFDYPATPWEHPRVVYLQHGSDPIVRWNAQLAVVKPRWLSEPVGGDVSPDVRWIPFVTFWQVSADMPFAREVPDGHGHNYRALYVDAWAHVVEPAGWTAADTKRLQALLEAQRESRGGKD